ncbi:hypothetical protein K2X05_05340 [bacterium]|nr:hypothetical protein [bacterium]
MSQSFNANSENEETNNLKTLKTLGIYLWPEKRWDLRLRVVAAVLFLILAKVLNMYVPFLLKDAVDVFSKPLDAITLPVALLLSYGCAL